MDIDLIFKVAGIGIIVAVLNLVLKRAEREEQAMLTTLAGLIVVLMLVITEIQALFDTVKSVFGLWRRYFARQDWLLRRFSSQSSSGDIPRNRRCC